MCGICGLLSRNAAPERGTIAAMMRALVHRGPDGDGLHVDAPVALGHRRLSIIDLSDAAREPMTNEDGTLWLVFNGEIYNFRELSKDLKARHRFRSQGDGEVILHLYEERGDGAVAALDGMFAFASEVKALLAHPGVPRAHDPSALPLYLTYGYVPTPGTFYQGIRALPPAHFLVATEKGCEGPTPYWSVRFQDGIVGDDREAEERFRSLLQEAVTRRLVADVPLRSFLSGGLHSSSIVAFMARAAGGRVRTFTIGFKGGKEYDETPHARTVAEAFGTDHTEFVVEPKALELIDRLVWRHDGPFVHS